MSDHNRDTSHLTAEQAKQIEEILRCHKLKLSTKRTSEIIGVCESYIMKVIIDHIGEKEEPKREVKKITKRSNKYKFIPEKKYRKIFTSYLNESMLKHAVLPSELAKIIDIKQDMVVSYLKGIHLPDRQIAKRIFQYFNSNHNTIDQLVSKRIYQKSYRQVNILNLLKTSKRSKRAFSQYLIQNMQNHQISVDEIADKLNISSDRVTSYTKGIYLPTGDTAKKIFDLFNSKYDTIKQLVIHERTKYKTLKSEDSNITKKIEKRYKTRDLNYIYRQIFTLYFNLELAKTELKPGQIRSELNISRQLIYNYKHTAHLPEISMQKKIFTLFNSNYETVEDLVGDFLN